MWKVGDRNGWSRVIETIKMRLIIQRSPFLLLSNDLNESYFFYSVYCLCDMKRTGNDAHDGHVRKRFEEMIRDTVRSVPGRKREVPLGRNCLFCVFSKRKSCWHFMSRKQIFYKINKKKKKENLKFWERKKERKKEYDR